MVNQMDQNLYTHICNGYSVTVLTTPLWCYWWTRRQAIGMVHLLAGFSIYPSPGSVANMGRYHHFYKWMCDIMEGTLRVLWCLMLFGVGLQGASLCSATLLSHDLNDTSFLSKQKKNYGVLSSSQLSTIWPCWLCLNAVEPEKIR